MSDKLATGLEIGLKRTIDYLDAIGACYKIKHGEHEFVSSDIRKRSTWLPWKGTGIREQVSKIGIGETIKITAPEFANTHQTTSYCSSVCVHLFGKQACICKTSADKSYTEVHRIF